MSNLPITAHTITSAGKSGNPLQAATEAAVIGVSRRSHAQAISAHIGSASGMSAARALPVSFSDLLSRHLAIPESEVATDAVAKLSAIAAKEDGNDGAKRDSALPAASDDAAIVLAGALHNAIPLPASSAAADVSVAPPARSEAGRNQARANFALNALAARHPATAERRTGKDIGVADALPGNNLAHDVATTSDTVPDTASGTGTAPAAATTQADPGFAQSVDKVEPKQQNSKSVVADKHTVPNHERQGTATVPSPDEAAKTDRAAKADSAATSIPPAVATVPAATQPGEKIAGAMSRPGKDSDNTVAAGATRNPAVDLAAVNMPRVEQSRAAATLNIATPLASNAWPNDFVQKIVWLGDQKHQVAELHLNPPDLGPLEVVLKVSGNQASAQFVSAHSAVRDAVENAIPRLREILAENGVTLGNTSVSDQAPQYRGADGSNSQGFSGNTRHETPTPGMSAADSNSADKPVAAVRQHNGLVDTFA